MSRSRSKRPPTENRPRGTPARPPLSLRKRLLFGGIMAVLGVALFFGALEGVLSLVGYGYEPRFFRFVSDREGNRWIQENRDFTLTYFAPELVRRPHPFRLPEKKAPGTYRIFVLGESAALGDPAPSFSLSRTLEMMLRAAYPDVRFEVVNAAITAVNSHVMRAVAADCEELEPDLYVVYAGHNEVIGPFGPAAVFAPFLRSPLAIDSIVRLGRTRTGQGIRAIARSLGSGPVDVERWRGMTLFHEHEITMDDPRLRDMEALFEHNLRAVAASARSRGAAAIFCTVLTNQRDFAPFRSRHREGSRTRSGGNGRMHLPPAIGRRAPATWSRPKPPGSEHGGSMIVTRKWRFDLDGCISRRDAAAKRGSFCRRRSTAIRCVFAPTRACRP